jgi:hypothetical protein
MKPQSKGVMAFNRLSLTFPTAGVLDNGSSN